MTSCPLCRRPACKPYRPFCSKRCADLDLARWLRGDYVVPDSAPEVLPEDDEQDR